QSGLKLLPKPFEVTCRCGQRMSAKPQMAGKMVRCPRCADIVQLPGSAAEKSSTSSINVGCTNCGQRFLARQDLAGKAVKCPMCGKALTVTRPGTAQPATPPIEV